jgi:hypothetical protein
MRFRLTSWSILHVCCAALMATTGACSADTVESGPPATVAEAAKVLDLATFPLVKGAEKLNHRHLAGLSYNAPGTVKEVFEFQRKQLTEQKWKELPGSYISDQAASAAFARNGFSVSVSVSPSGDDGAVSVTIINHGNIQLSKLSIPAGVKPFYGGPVNASYITETPVEKTSEECRKLLLEQGWQPYGAAGDVQFFKQNAIRLSARVSSAPAQGGKTVIDYSTLLMSRDLVAPADTEGLQYTDTPAQLFFDTKATQQDVVNFYQQTLAKADWEATTENLIKIDFKELMIFRNPQEDMLTLELTDVDGKTRVLLKFQSAAEIAELDRLVKADAERKKLEKNKPLPKLALALPADARDVEQTKTRIEFKIATGKAKALVESWRKQFAKDGWHEQVATLEDLAGAISFEKGQQSISVIYQDTKILPAEITVSAHGVELQRAAEKK